MKNHFAIGGGRIEYGIYPAAEASLGPSDIATLTFCPPEFGNYLTDGRFLYAEFAGKYYLVSHIKWQAVQREGNMVLAITEDAIDSLPYDIGKNPKNNYKGSHIRSFLTKDFMKLAFPDGGKRLKGGKYAVDKITLPSVEFYSDPALGFNTSEAWRVLTKTNYAVARGESSYTWTSTPSHNNHSVLFKYRNRCVFAISPYCGELFSRDVDQSGYVRLIAYIDIGS